MDLLKKKVHTTAKIKTIFFTLTNFYNDKLWIIALHHDMTSPEYNK